MPALPLELRPTITVVSGLPRSGTSMMMQMLAAAGLELATDGLRRPDSDNPNGYFELDAVRGLPRDASFLKGVVGQVVKIVSPLLRHLPSDHDYRVVFMDRDLDEVLASQRAMMSRSGGDDEGPEVDEKMARAFANQLERTRTWLAERSNISTCYVRHDSVLASPEPSAKTIMDFLARTGAFEGLDSGALDPQAVVHRMAAVVDPALQHQR